MKWAVAVGIALLAACAVSAADAQAPDETTPQNSPTAATSEGAAAEISGKFTIPVPDNSTLRITNPRMEICADIPLGAPAVSYREVLSPSARCQLSPGDALGFWLIYPNGGLELLSAAGGQFPRWMPGGIITADLGKVPCPDPCRPPDVAGAPDPGLALPGTGAGGDGGSLSVPWGGLVLVVVALGLGGVVLRRRARRA